MGITYRVDRDNNVLLATAEGRITLEDVRQHLLQEEKSLALGYPELVDGRRASVGFSGADVNAIVQMLRTLSRRNSLGPTAVVVSDDVSYGVMRMMQMLVEDVCVIQPFRNLTEAENWLRAWNASL